MEPFILGGLGLIIIVTPMWFQVLSKLPLSVAYPMVSIGYIVAVGIGVIFLKESIPPLRIVGVAFIMVGSSCTVQKLRLFLTVCSCL